MSTWNPRYLAYAAAHGRSPSAQLAHDAATHPGGKMAGFITWISARLTMWRTLHGLRSDAPLLPAHHDAFTEWLGTAFLAQEAA